ncbi:hypothetical protein CJ030_MR1G013801 [Morella rubra]|uniref:Uncharacterized protein n=1 Tax=Morella rubra TaxID=262757 RepID=A0A6A1WRJ7_9ROSI|nr:hypothetical protein CJ030_MR1G013801 [Morella rubra]
MEIESIAGHEDKRDLSPVNGSSLEIESIAGHDDKRDLSPVNGSSLVHAPTVTNIVGVGDEPYGLPSDESFFDALIIEKSPEETSSVHDCSGEQDRFRVIPDQVSGYDILSTSLGKREACLLALELLGSDFGPGPLVSLEVFLRVLQMNASKVD